MFARKLTPQQESINKNSFKFIEKPISPEQSDNKIEFEYAKAIGEMSLLINIIPPNSDEKIKSSEDSKSKTYAIETYDDIPTIHLFTTNDLEEKSSPFRHLDNKYTQKVVNISDIHDFIEELNVENNDFLTMIHNGPTGNDTLTLKPDDIHFVYTTYINPTYFIGGVDDPFRTIIEKFGREDSNKKIKNIYAIRTYDKNHNENYNLDLYFDHDDAITPTKIDQLNNLLSEANTKLSKQVQINNIRFFDYKKDVLDFINATNLQPSVYHRLSPWENILKLVHDFSHPAS